MKRTKKRVVLPLLAIGSVCLMACVSSAASIFYEPFDYTAGSAISDSPDWHEAGPATSPVHQVISGSLTAPSGLSPSVGNAAGLMAADNTQYLRRDLPQQFGPSSTLYYSLLVNVPSLDELTTPNTNLAANNGVFIGFNNNMGPQATRPSLWAGALTIRLGTAANTFNLGVRSSAGTGTSTYWTQDLNPGQTYFAVVRYESGAVAGTDGMSSLWLDPSPATFRAAVAPLPDGSAPGRMNNTASLDHVDSMLIGAGIQAGFAPTQNNIDEIRVGTTWASVTVPEPASLGLFVVGWMLTFASRRRG